MLNQMGWGKRILISRRDTRSSPVDYAAAGTPWDEMCEIYPDDFAALAGLGTPTLTAGNGVGTPNKKVGVAVIVRNEHGHYLMHKRLSGASGNKGKWGAPGGQLEYGETVLGAAVREFREETGCVLFDAAIEVVTEASDWVCFVVQGHYTGAPVRPDSERAKAEEWCWLSASQLVESRLRGEVSSGLDSWIDGTEIARGLASQVDRGPLNTRTVRLP
jgi:8-oxo-dGTP pyrophosphatase MutT (NUDIX family)